MGNGMMEAVYYGCNDTHPLPNGSLVECTKGPYVYSDLEEMHHMMTELPPTRMPIDKPVHFLASLVKGKPGQLVLLAGDISKKGPGPRSGTGSSSSSGGGGGDVGGGGGGGGGGFQTVYDGPYPSDYRPSRKEGAIVLGVGGDNSPWGSGTWFEGAMTTGFADTATTDAVFANLAAAGYVDLHVPRR